LLSIPRLICEACNAGDEKKLTSIFESYFEENCLFENGVIDTVGRNHIIEHYIQSTRTVPDGVRVYKNVLVQDRQIVAAISFSGTKERENDAYEHDLFSVKNFDEVNKSHAISALLGGQRYGISISGTLQFVPNKTLTKFISLIATNLVVTVSPVTWLDDF